MTVDLDAAIRRIPNHPTPGILFYDVMPVFESPDALSYCVERLAEQGDRRGATAVLGIEARGLILGGAIAHRLGVGLAVARKPGKLPGATLGRDYSLEYGSDSLELHVGALTPGDRVLVHDDLLATGGTADAACALVEQCGAEVVGCAFLVELSFLAGRARLERAGRSVESLVAFASEAME